MKVVIGRLKRVQHLYPIYSCHVGRKVLAENFNRLKRPSSIYIQHFFSTIVHSFFYFQNGRVQGCSCDGGYLQNIFHVLKVEHQMGFKDMFRMSVTDYEFLFLLSSYF